MTLLHLVALATIAGHPHADCSEAPSTCIQAPVHREPVRLIAVPRDFPERWRAQMADGFGASAYTFYMERGESRVPISRTDAATFARDPEVKRAYEVYRRWHVSDEGLDNNALREVLWQRRLGVSSRNASWALFTRDASLYVAVAPVSAGMTLYNAMVSTWLTPGDEVLIEAADIEVHSATKPRSFSVPD